MNKKARLGWWVLIVVIVVTALTELTLAALSLQAGRFRGSQVGRVLLTGWLFWQVWDGAGWARWLTAGLFLAAAVFGVAVGLGSPGLEGRLEAQAVVAGVGAMCGAFGFGLASPWVGAYQSARRGLPDAEPAAEPDPAAGSLPEKHSSPTRPDR